MSRIFKVGIVQETAASPDIAANVARAVSAVRAAHAQGAQVICLQELFNAPYFCQTLDMKWFDLAEPIPGPTTDRMQALAKELAVVLIVPIYEREAAGLYRNSAAVIDADGALLGVYRKMHIPHDPHFEEKYYFAPGDTDGRALAAPGKVKEADGFRVWRTQYANIGVLICWDQWYPEGARLTSLLGADILFYPTAIGWHPREKAEFGEAQVTAWRTIQRAHAIANGVFVASPNRVGFETAAGSDGLEFFGNSTIYDPFGRILAEAGTEPTVLVATCDTARIEDTRRNWPFLRDRRIDAYGGLSSRFLG
ncbi:MAG: carbon-nitrogen hydrolase [Gemmatimonadaceae bacterium]|nr:carbon-nitrogen hydrolase [Gemmatimonadaceae bacterium]